MHPPLYSDQDIVRQIGAYLHSNVQAIEKNSKTHHGVFSFQYFLTEKILEYMVFFTCF